MGQIVKKEHLGSISLSWESLHNNKHNGDVDGIGKEGKEKLVSYSISGVQRLQKLEGH